MRHSTFASLLLLAVAATVVPGCGDDDDGSGPPPDEDLVVELEPTSSGDGQTGVVGEVLANDLRILITRADEPEAGVEVEWATGDGGSLNPTTSVSDANGIATSAWTLGPEPGEQAATATVTDAQGSPVTFTATATEDGAPPPPEEATVEVLNNRFAPIDVTIQEGGTVTWVWPSGSVNHNVTPDGTEPSPSGPPENGPAQHSYTFNTPGTFAYHCQVHGAEGGVGMSGTVTVAAAP
jgi:plastocyanin